MFDTEYYRGYRILWSGWKPSQDIVAKTFAGQWLAWKVNPNGTVEKGVKHGYSTALVAGVSDFDCTECRNHKEQARQRLIGQIGMLHDPT